MVVNKDYSFKDFMGISFKANKVEEFNDTEIIGSCFYQECDFDDPTVEKDIFPDGIKGVIFKKCNLDNVLIPSENIVEIDCTHKKIKVQNDLMKWVLDDTTLEPIEPINKTRYLELGLSIDPKNISKTKLTKSITQQKEEELISQLEAS